MHDIIEKSVVQSYEKDFELLDIMDENLTLELEKLEAVLDKHPSNGDLDFSFSYKNKKLLQKLVTDFLRSFDVANKIPQIKRLQYGLVYYILQSSVRLINWQVPYKEPNFDMETKLQRLAYFSKYAIGIYGPDELYESTISEQKALLFTKGTDREQFMFWSNTSEEEMLDGFFQNRECL